MEGCLTPQIFTDYSGSARHAAEYVRLRREALTPLITHHLLGGLEIQFTTAEGALCRASMLISRVQNIPKDVTLRNTAGEFHTHCHYTFHLVKEIETWKIGGVIQKVLWNSGTHEIHSSVKD